MKFNINQIEVALFLGTTPEEQSEKQIIQIDFYFETECSKAMKSDNIKDTTDYFSIYQFIKSFPGEKPYCLIEHLHKNLLERLKQTFPEINKAKLRITKFPFPDANVTIEL